jgi:hypothetical protein
MKFYDNETLTVKPFEPYSFRINDPKTAKVHLKE